MCSRYYFDNDTMNDILNIVKETDASLRGMQADRDIYPTDDAAVIIRNAAGGIKLSKVKWGYPGINGSGIIINARAESALDKKMFEGGIRRRRAVIPAEYFYEWSRNKEKNTFRRKDRDTVYMAGFYDLTDAGERFIILTTQANASMIKIHDRMPLILEKGQIKDWVLDDTAVDHFLRQTPVLLDRETEYEQQTLFDLT
ncbi:MAG: SOS response-associated peptidase [Lachnospiraceae bacterium]|nr:SOS response-associated peptidase [Lachnospiraceae bacterium]